MILTVAKQDIADGLPGNPYACALALSAMRRFGLVDNEDISVDHRWMTVYDLRAGAVIRYTLPEKAIEWQSDFDEGKSVKPCKLDIGEGTIMRRITWTTS